MARPTAPTRRRWSQFTLRTLLILVTGVAGLAFGWMKLVEPYRLQRQAMAAITKLGGSYKTEEATGWIKYLEENSQDVVVVDLADCDRPEEYLPHLARLPRLRTLVVGGHSVGNEQIAALGRIASLKGLVLDSTLVRDEGLGKLKALRSDIVIFQSQRRACEACSRLGAILRSGDDLVDSDRLLRDDVNLSYFRTPPLSATFAHDTTGSSLTLPHLTDTDLIWLTDLHALDNLILDGTAVTGTAFHGTARLPSLTYLSLSHTKVNDDTIGHLVHVAPHVNWLYLDGTAVSDKGLQALAPLQHLKELHLCGTHITGVGLKHLHHLTSLYASGSQMDNETIPIVADMPSLDTLLIGGTSVTDEGLAHLIRAKRLQHLYLSGPTITDHGVSYLCKLTWLADLHLEQTGISKDGIQSLRNALPKCEIEH